ncbi:MAG TPA: hypothetical protein VJN89_08990 [Candidatus Acidoferrum sp.]|nr:hypothetical protein [Candidatus Acidoferrum sp.]
MSAQAPLSIVRLLLCTVFLCEPSFAQQAQPGNPAPAPQATESNRPGEGSSLVLDVYVQAPENTNAEVTAAVMVFTAEGQLFRQGITKKGHWLASEIVPAKYEIQVFAPGYERAVQPADASGTGELTVNVHLQPQTGGEKYYPAVSSDAEVNYVLGLYASRLGDWQQAKLYLVNCLQLLPNYVPAMVAMSEALLSENKALDATEYLVRAERLDPAYWRTQALLAEVALRAGSAGEAVLHAERAMELGHQEASSVSPLLARALVARANEVLLNYLKDHPQDVAARKQLESLNAPSEAHVSEPPSGDLKERSTATTASKPMRSGDARWSPPDVDENVPPVEAGTACNVAEVLEKTGKRIQEFVGNVDRFTATESLVHETLSRSGSVSRTEKRQYDYVVSIEEIRPGILDLEEYEGKGSVPVDPPGGMVTKGLSALALIFHPYYSGTFSMRCEGLATLDGKRAWQLYFQQRKDKPNQIRAYRAGSNRSYPIDLKGRAWIIADSYQILSLQTDLIAPVPDIRLATEHTAIEYGPVNFRSRGLDMWLPQAAEVYMGLKGKHIHRRISFSNYLLFAVDDKQQIATPKTDR